MAISIPPYPVLKAGFPAKDLAAVKSLVGGGADANYITNACVIRVSRALNYAGAPIPGNHEGLLTVKGTDKLNYALRVREFRKYMRATYGTPLLTSNGGLPPSEWANHRGIIIFEVSGWTDATGHADLWNGHGCEYQGYWHKASEVLLWASPTLSAALRSLWRDIASS